MEFGTDAYFMQKALEEALVAFEEGEIPVGAVVVLGSRIIGRAHNQTERLHDPTAHAEMLAITAATQHLGTRYLTDCRLYVTLEPCCMCAGGLHWAQIGSIIIGAPDDKRGYSRYSLDIPHPKTRIIRGVLEEDCRKIMTRFFKNLR